MSDIKIQGSDRPSLSGALESQSDSLWNLLPSMRKRDMFSTLLSLFGATFGTGCLGLTAAMAKVGIVGWFILYVLAIGINYMTFDALIYFADTLGLSNYVDISKIIGGQRTRGVILFLFFVTNIGILLSASVIYNDLVCNIVKELGVTNHILTSQLSLIWLVVPALFLMPVLLKHKLKDVAFLTVISLGSAFYIVFFLFLSMLYLNNGRPASDASPLVLNIANSSEVFGYLLFVLLCQPNIMGIYQELSVKTVSNMKKLLVWHLIFISFIYIIMSVFGYILFYDKPEVFDDTILDLFKNNKSGFLFIANLLMTISAINSFIFSFKPLKDTIIGLIVGDKGDDLEQKDVEESDYDPLNVSVTAVLACFMLTISGLLILSKVKFLNIIDLLCNIVLPVLFIFLPLYAYLKQKRNPMIYAALGISLIFYSWRMTEYVYMVTNKLFA